MPSMMTARLILEQLNRIGSIKSLGQGNVIPANCDCVLWRIKTLFASRLLYSILNCLLESMAGCRKRRLAQTTIGNRTRRTIHARIWRPRQLLIANIQVSAPGAKPTAGMSPPTPQCRKLFSNPTHPDFRARDRHRTAETPTAARGAERVELGRKGRASLLDRS